MHNWPKNFNRIIFKTTWKKFMHPIVFTAQPSHPPISPVASCPQIVYFVLSIYSLEFDQISCGRPYKGKWAFVSIHDRRSQSAEESAVVAIALLPLFHHLHCTAASQWGMAWALPFTGILTWLYVTPGASPDHGVLMRLGGNMGYRHQ